MEISLINVNVSYKRVILLGYQFLLCTLVLKNISLKQCLSQRCIFWGANSVPLFLVTLASLMRQTFGIYQEKFLRTLTSEISLISDLCIQVQEFDTTSGIIRSLPKCFKCISFPVSLDRFVRRLRNFTVLSHHSKNLNQQISFTAWLQLSFIWQGKET